MGDGSFAYVEFRTSENQNFIKFMLPLTCIKYSKHKVVIHRWQNVQMSGVIVAVAAKNNV